MEDNSNKKRCFVVMGFGIKTDLATGRKLNLDKSYQALIKPVVESKGIICVRADEIPNSGPIDVPLYNELYKADVVVADLSTANTNAFYELGVRYALRPRTTIVMSEDKLCYPFDVNHIQISQYTHLGDSIDYFEVLRFQKLLGEKLDAVLADNTADSPVYTFLNGLIPPALQAKAEEVGRQVNEAITNSPQKNPADSDQTNTVKAENVSLSIIIAQGEDAIKSKQFSAAKGLFNSAILISNCNDKTTITSNSAYLYQRLAFATYKANEPDTKTALKDATALLNKLDLSHTNDAETVALAGAIEKKLYEIGEGEDHLDDAILLYLRAYYLLNSSYNGTNLAFLLNCRAESTLDKTKDEKIADTVWANRVRQDVLRICDKDWNALMDRKKLNSQQDKIEDEKLLKSQESVENEQKFWILANKAEANFGLGNMTEYQNTLAQLQVIDHEDWMLNSFNAQIDALKKVLNITDENQLKSERQQLVSTV